MVQLKDESYDQFKNSDKQPLPSFHKAVFIGGVSLQSTQLTRGHVSNLATSILVFSG